MYNEDNEIYEKIADFLIDLTASSRILKHRNGNIILKVPLMAYSRAINGIEGISLSKVLENFGGIKDYDFSFFWSTLEIQYDTAIISGDLWEDLIGGSENRSQRTVIRQRLVQLLNGSLRGES